MKTMTEQHENASGKLTVRWDDGDGGEIGARRGNKILDHKTKKEEAVEEKENQE